MFFIYVLFWYIRIKVIYLYSNNKYKYMAIKNILCKSLRLEQCLKTYLNDNETKRLEVHEKFKTVWGGTLANHFLSKYNDAESLIWALDEDNLTLFVNKF